MDNFPSLYKTRNKSHHGRHDITSFLEKSTILGDILGENSNTDLNTIYIHVPFCEKICSFCNMARTIGLPENNYVDLVVKNLDIYGKSSLTKSQTINSIYFGGGTPTTLDISQFNTIFDSIYKNFKISEDVEISVETSLSNLDKNKLESLIDMGVNRISVGVQTFDDNGREYFNRLGDSKFAIERINEYKSTGLKNINVDIIYCYPGGSLEISKKDLEILNELDIGGFSLYSLITSTMGKPGPQFFTLEEEFEIFNNLTTLAKSFGYDFFELTKMVKPGRDRYQYIINSYENKNIFPIGPASGGSLNNSKLRNPMNIKKYEEFLDNFYSKEIDVYSTTLSEIEKEANTVQVGYINRRYDGSSSKISEFIKSLENKGLIKLIGNIYKLTEMGIFFGNNIYHEYIDLLLDYYKGE